MRDPRMARDGGSDSRGAPVPERERGDRGGLGAVGRSGDVGELAFLGLGAHLGDRRGNILRALSLLVSEGPIEVLATVTPL